MKKMSEKESNPLVSIITPCYNGEIFLHRFLDSVLNQTYNKIEFIFINDGSTDNTENIILAYKNKFLSKGIIFKYVYQKNLGQAAAINRGLLLFKGEYLTWPDSDDWMTSDCIEKKVRFMQKNPDYGICLGEMRCVSEDHIDKEMFRLSRKSLNENIFDDLIVEKDIFFAPGGYMVDSEKFLEVIPNRHIYESRAGQNWQLLLPISYKYKCGFVNDVVGTYLIRKDSHSHMDETLDHLIEKTYDHEDILLVVINGITMPDTEKFKYKTFIKNKYKLKRFNTYCEYKKIDLVKQNYQMLKKCNLINYKIKIKYYRTMFKMFDLAYKYLFIPFKGLLKKRESV